MKSQILLIFFVFPGILWSQTVDSLTIFEVNRLLQYSFELTKRQSYDSSLVIIQQAEQMALERIGESSTYYGEACFLHGRIFHVQGDTYQAETWYKKSADILRPPGTFQDSLVYAECLNYMAILKLNFGDYTAAKAMFIEEIAIRRQLGQGRSRYASSILNLAIVYEEESEYAEAEKNYLEAKELLSQSLGLEHPSYASCVNNLGGLYITLGKHDQAEVLLKEAIAIRRKLPGDNDEELAKSIHNLAKLYAQLERVDEAYQFYFEAKKIRDTLFADPNQPDREHPLIAESLIDIAKLHIQMGQFAEAEKMLLHARNILDRWQSANNKYLNFDCLIQLASLYSRMGQFDKAEALFLEIRRTTKEGFDQYDPIAILSISKLGLFYQSVGDEQKAEELFKEHLLLLKNSLKNQNRKTEESEEYGKSLNVLANLYSEQGRDSLAKPLFEEALTVFEGTIGNRNSNYATVVNSLASLEFNAGRHEQAELLFLEALSIYADTLGKQHPYYAACLGSLGNLYFAKGEFDKAEPMCLESRDILKSQYGTQHPAYIFSVKSLANFYEKRGNYAKADTLLEEIFMANEARIALAASFMSEQELEKYIALFQADGNDLYAYLYARTVNEQPLSKLTKLAYDHTLYYKGFLLLAARRLSKLAISTEESARLFTRLKDLRKNLAFEYAKPISSRHGVDSLEVEANSIEKQLIQQVAGYGQAIQQVRWTEVQKALQEDEVAIEFVHFMDKGQEGENIIRYAALILRAQSTSPEFAYLCTQEELGVRVRLKSERREEYVRVLYSNKDRGLSSDGTPTKPLYDLIWQPLEEKGLSDIQTIYFSPSGLLHRINLGAIPINRDSVVTNRYQMIMVNSSRQLPGGRSDRLDSMAKEVQLFGGIEFDIPAEVIAAVSAHDPENAINDTGDPQVDANDRGVQERWDYLQGTVEELDSIKTIFKRVGYSIQDKSGMLATEEYVKEMGQSDHISPSIIHMATHGFFYEAPEENSQNEALTIFKKSEEPMMRSGLILSGANFAWTKGRPLQEGAEDGILTAYEISQMDLSQTELVVLSACETGLGDIKQNEGVYGLQRAFKIAGVKYLIMTLWKVDDEETAEFMIQFYKHLLNENRSIPEAFRLTQLEFIPNNLRKPYYWAGFVLLE